METKVLGIVVVAGFVFLTLLVTATACAPQPIEGFEVKVPHVGPPPTTLTGKKEPTGLTSVSDLPSAPITGLAETNSRPYQDPVTEKVSVQMLNELKQDMDGFVAFEVPYLKDRSDPAVKMPLMRLQGDYQRVKDELRTVQNTPGFQPQLTVMDLQDMAANLRFLQRAYRVYSESQMVPAPQTGLSKVGVESFEDLKEGFADGDASKTPITVDELKNLSTRLAVEITRLQASGATDPVLQARVQVFTGIRQRVDDLNKQITAGTLSAKDIPIMKSDYNKFLPALGTNSGGIGGLLSKTGNSTLSSLFNSYDKGDISGAEIASALFETYADSLLNGLSYNFNLTYTSPNEVKVQQAKASSWDAQRALGIMDQTTGNLAPYNTQHPGTVSGSRGNFDETVRRLDIAGFQTGQEPINAGARPPSFAPTKIGSFDWKKKSEEIATNIQRSGFDPQEFGCLPRGSRVSSDFSWRGHCRMVCSRLSTHQDPGFPEQMGCPPVNWKGWKL